MRRKIIVLIMLFYVGYAAAKGDQTNNYLLHPAGSYGVGYQDVILINTGLCPDTFYRNNVNDRDYSAVNKKHCHEIALRIYYPSQKALELGDVYYAPYLEEINSWIMKKHQLPTEEASQLNSLLQIKTFASANVLPVDKQKFPVIVFMPGSGTPVQAYNNIVSNLVSHGYIVIGLNSLFINGALHLEGGHIVSPPDAYLDEDARKTNLSDLKFVLEHITQIKYKFNLDRYMDFNNIALIGHSRGAMTIVNLLKVESCKTIRSIILMDPGNMLMKMNYPLPKFKIPSIVMWSSHFKEDMQGASLLGVDNYEIILKPKNAKDSFSNHEDFSDKSTLKYHPAYQIQSVRLGMSVGDSDGYVLAKEINDIVLSFLNEYLKNINNDKFLSCKDKNKNYILKCGQ